MISVQIKTIYTYIETLFRYYDKKNHGTLLQQEIVQILNDICYDMSLPYFNNDQLQILFNKIKQNNSSKISLDYIRQNLETIKSMFEQHRYTSCVKVFNIYKSENKNELNEDQLKVASRCLVVKMNLSNQESDKTEIFKMIDSYSGVEISLEEFINHFEKVNQFISKNYSDQDPTDILKRLNKVQTKEHNNHNIGLKNSILNINTNVSFDEEGVSNSNSPFLRGKTSLMGSPTVTNRNSYRRSGTNVRFKKIEVKKFEYDKDDQIRSINKPNSTEHKKRISRMWVDKSEALTKIHDNEHDLIRLKNCNDESQDQDTNKNIAQKGVKPDSYCLTDRFDEREKYKAFENNPMLSEEMGKNFVLYKNKTDSNEFFNNCEEKGLAYLDKNFFNDPKLKINQDMKGSGKVNRCFDRKASERTPIVFDNCRKTKQNSNFMDKFASPSKNSGNRNSSDFNFGKNNSFSKNLSENFHYIDYELAKTAENWFNFKEKVNNSENQSQLLKLDMEYFENLKKFMQAENKEDFFSNMGADKITTLLGNILYQKLIYEKVESRILLEAKKFGDSKPMFEKVSYVVHNVMHHLKIFDKIEESKEKRFNFYSKLTGDTNMDYVTTKKPSPSLNSNHLCNKYILNKESSIEKNFNDKFENSKHIHKNSCLQDLKICSSVTWNLQSKFDSSEKKKYNMENILRKTPKNGSILDSPIHVVKTNRQIRRAISNKSNLFVDKISKTIN